MKKFRYLTLALSFLLLLSSSCQSKKDTKEADGTQPQSGEITLQENKTNGGVDAPQMVIAREGETISAGTPYFSASQVNVYEPKSGESIQRQECAVTEQGIYILLSIYNNEVMNTFYEQAEAENWLPEEEEKRLMDAEKESFRTELFILDAEGQLKTSINMSSIMPDKVAYIGGIRTAGNGELFLIGSGIYNEQMDSQDSMIIKIDEDGNPTGEVITIGSQEGAQQEIKNYYNFVRDSKGNFFAYGYVYTKNEGVGRNFIDVMNSDGELLFSFNNENNSTGNNSQFGENFLGGKDTVYTSINYNTLVPLDVDEQKIGEEIKVDIYLDRATVKEQKIYSCDSGGMYSFDLENRQKEALFLWKDLDVDIPEYYGTPYVISDDKIFLMIDSYDWTTGNPILAFYLLTREESNPNAGKTIIQVGGYQITDPTLSKIIRNFNLQHDDCRIEMLDYFYSDGIQSEMDDFTNLQSELNMKFLSGEIPDVLIGRPIFINFPLYASKNLFADLNTFIANDDSFQKEKYLDIMFTLPTKEDKLYYTFTSFSVDGVLTKKSTLNGKNGWTLSEMETILSSSPDGRAFFTNSSQSEILHWLLGPSFSSIVDVPSRTSNLNSDYFKGILNLCKKYGLSQAEWDSKMQMMEMSPQEWVSPPQQIKNGEISFAVVSYSAVEHWKSVWNMSGTDITLVGFPGESDSNIVCDPYEFVAISAERKNQDIAWEFVKELFSLDGQENVYYGFPVLHEALEIAIEKEQKPDADIDLNEIPELTPLSSEGAEELRKFVQSPTIISSAADSQIRDIIMQESEAFFAGQKDIDETVRVIQERVTTYLNQL